MCRPVPGSADRTCRGIEKRRWAQPNAPLLAPTLLPASGTLLDTIGVGPPPTNREKTREYANAVKNTDEVFLSDEAAAELGYSAPLPPQSNGHLPPFVARPAPPSRLAWSPAPTLKPGRPLRRPAPPRWTPPSRFAPRPEPPAVRPPGRFAQPRRTRPDNNVRAVWFGQVAGGTLFYGPWPV